MNQRSPRYLGDTYCPVVGRILVMEATIAENIIVQLQEYGVCVRNPSVKESYWVAELEKFFECLLNSDGIPPAYLRDPMYVERKPGVVRDFYDTDFFYEPPYT